MTMPPLEVPEELDEAIAKFIAVDSRDEAKLGNYSQVAELLSAYVKNARCYALFPSDTNEFAENINKALKTLDIFIEMTAYSDAFGTCTKQWRETTEHIFEFVTDLMKSLDELGQRAATSSKPVTSKDAKVKARTVRSVLIGQTLLRAEEQVTIVGEAFGKAGFVRVDTSSGDRAMVPLIGLTSCSENTELLTFYMSSVHKMKQCVDQIRKETSSKFWALARSYFQSRSKQEFLFIADIRGWRTATDALLKLDDNNTGFSFKPCINGILNNALPRKIPDAFDVTKEETDSLHDFIQCYQQVVNLLALTAENLRAVDKIGGEDWQMSLLRAGSLQIQSGTQDQQPIASQAQTLFSTLIGQSPSKDYLQQTVQQTTKRGVVTTNSYEPLLSEQVVQQSSYRSMRSGDKFLQPMNPFDTDNADGDIHRVTSRSSSVTSESTGGKWQVQHSTITVPASPIPSPVLMSAKMESKEQRRGIMEDFCFYETKFRDMNTMTNSVTIVSENDVLEQQVQLQEAKRLLTRLESRTTRVTDSGSSSDYATDTSSVRISKEFVERLTLCHRDAPLMGSTEASREVNSKDNSVVWEQPRKPVTNSCVTVGKHLQALVGSTEASREVKSNDNSVVWEQPRKPVTNSSVTVGKHLQVESHIHYRLEKPIAHCLAQLEIDSLGNSMSFQQPVKTYLSNNVSIGQVLLDKVAWFPPEKLQVSNTQVSRTIDSVTQSANATVDYRMGNCRVQAAMVTDGLIIHPEAVNGNMISLEKPIVDNGVFRINELIDSWTEMQQKYPTESGAHYVQVKRDVKIQKNATRPPQVECGVGDNLQLGGGGSDMAVQTGGPRGTIEFGISAGESGAGGDISSRRRRNRGTDMSERHVICDTGVCASTNRIVKIESEELAIRRPRQELQPSTPLVQDEAKELRTLEVSQPKPETQQQPQQQTQHGRREHTLSLGGAEQNLQASWSFSTAGKLLDVADSGVVQSPGRPVFEPVVKRPVTMATEFSNVLQTEIILKQQHQQQQLQPQKPPPQRMPTKSRDTPDPLPDKEWRYPVNRKDFRPNPENMPKPQLVYADTGLPLASPSSIVQSPTSPYIEPPKMESGKARQRSLPRLHKSNHRQQPQSTPSTPILPIQSKQQQPPGNYIPDQRPPGPGFSRSQSSRLGQPASRSDRV